MYLKRSINKLVIHIPHLDLRKGSRYQMYRRYLNFPSLRGQDIPAVVYESLWIKEPDKVNSKL